MGRIRCWLLVVCLLCPALQAQNPPAAPDSSKPAQYIGYQECKGCHEDLYNAFESNPHWKTSLDTRRGPAFQGCEGCHGPGSKHADSFGATSIPNYFPKMPAAEVVKVCLTCHVYGEEHGNFRRSAHKSANISCINCHSPHHFKEAQYMLRMPQVQLCTSCHADVKPDFAKPFHHRVEEGLVKCTDCHNQHGGYLTKQLRSTAAQDAICGQCHSEKVGPFVFEHAPIKTEGCTACHAPHGSANPRLLKRSQMNLLCLECHTVSTGSSARGTPGFHNQDQKFQSCTLCHVSIHGSNFDQLFLK